MKRILYLLITAAMFGAVRGAEVGAEVQGLTNIDVDPCSTEDQVVILYQECVINVAVSLGLVLSRRLQVRGDRDLSVCSGCGSCPECYPKGHFCYVWCHSSRRLTLTDNVTDEAARIVKGQIQQGANDCLDDKIDEGYTCLGDKNDLRIKIFLSQ
jgi:hypothetical protein